MAISMSSACLPICTTVLGRLLGYSEDQLFKPETWRKLERGIALLADGRARASALE